MFLSSSLPFESKPYLTPPKPSTPKGMPLIPFFRKQTVSHAAKTKHPKRYSPSSLSCEYSQHKCLRNQAPKRYAPHLYLANTLSTNASEIKPPKGTPLISILRILSAQMPQKSSPQKVRPSSLSCEYSQHKCLRNQAPKRYAPHLYLANTLSTNASEIKPPKSYAPHPYLSNANRNSRRQNQAPQKVRPLILLTRKLCPLIIPPALKLSNKKCPRPGASLVSYFLSLILAALPDSPRR